MNEKDNPILIMIVVVIVVFGGYYYFQSTEKEINNEVGIKPSSEVLSFDELTTTEELITSTPTNNTNSESSNSALPLIASDGAYMVYYLDQSFYPRELQVRQGATVRFINKSDRAMRVFSDTDKNNSFIELNQSKSLGKGGTYEFLFTKIGLWYYENQNYQYHQGSILVY